MARQERRFLQTKSQVLRQSFGSGPARLDLSLVRHGEGLQPRRGTDDLPPLRQRVGGAGLRRRTAEDRRVIDYPLFERIFYLLVAGYDVYGNVGHQLNSRLYMDFMRMEGEFNFLVFLPQRVRENTRCSGIRGATGQAREYAYGKNAISMSKAWCPSAAATRSASCLNCWASAWLRCSASVSTWPPWATTRLRAELQAGPGRGKPELAARDERVAH